VSIKESTMPKATKVWVLISIDDRGDPRVDEFDMLSALKVRMRGILSNDPQYKLLENGRTVSWDWGEPELHIGESSAPAKKPRAKRRTKAEMEAARASKANGKDHDAKVTA
jgi:hypothetical protein